MRTQLLHAAAPRVANFEAPSADALGQAGQVAELEFERIVEAVERSARQEEEEP